MADPTKACSNTGCHRPACIRGLCRSHYNYAMKSGRLKPQPRRTFDERFWSYVDRSGGSNSCWPWMGGRVKGGYGQFALGGGRGARGAHIVALELAEGESLPPGAKALHHCDNPPCCNPAHLFSGTQADNVQDMVTKGRQNTGRGERNGMSRITDEDVRQIRAHRAKGRIYRKIADDLGISLSQVGKVCRRIAWAHVA